MGYDLYITRQEDWSDDDESKKITLEEWVQFVNADPEMRLDHFAEAKLQNGDTIRIEKEGLSVWLKYSGDNVNGNHAWFYYTDGNISVKNPDPEIMYKMLSMAGGLRAKLQGDDGELYTAADIKALETYFSKEPRKSKPWWKFW